MPAAYRPDTLRFHPGTSRIPSLDGIRAIAALMVMCLHFTTLPMVPGWARSLALAGQTGVDLFFVLSGFLITRILVESRQSDRYFSRFYIRRVLRIFPLYYAFLVVHFFVLPLLAGVKPAPATHQIWSWLFLENIPLTFTGLETAGPNPYWSLAVEEHFYLLWPLLVFHLSGVRLTRALWAFILAAPLVRWWLLSEGLGPYYFTLSRMDGLALGALVACLYQPGRIGDARWTRVTRATVLVSGVGLVVMFVAYSGSGAHWLQVVKLSLTPGFYAAVLLFCLIDPASLGLRTLLAAPLLRWLGGLGYGLYVLHPLALMAALRLPPGTGLPLMFAAFVALTILFAFVSHRFFELPILRLRDRLADGPRTPAAESLVTAA